MGWTKAGPLESDIYAYHFGHKTLLELSASIRNYSYVFFKYSFRFVHVGIIPASI